MHLESLTCWAIALTTELPTSPFLSIWNSYLVAACFVPKLTAFKMATNVANRVKQDISLKRSSSNLPPSCVFLSSEFKLKKTGLLIQSHKIMNIHNIKVVSKLERWWVPLTVQDWLNSLLSLEWCAFCPFFEFFNMAIKIWAGMEFFIFLS